MTEITDDESAEIAWANSGQGKAAFRAAWQKLRAMGLHEHVDATQLGQIVHAAFATRTPWQTDRDRVELTGKWPEAWGPFHRHFANDAVHRDGGPECDQPGTPRRVYVFDPEYLSEHEAIVARHAAEQALKPLREILPQDYEIDAGATDEEARLGEIQALLYPSREDVP
jgi:hypothetical protein